VRLAVESSMPAVAFDKSPHEDVMHKIQQLLGMYGIHVNCHKYEMK
jgi:hypothetical protein